MPGTVSVLACGAGAGAGAARVGAELLAAHAAGPGRYSLKVHRAASPRPSPALEPHVLLLAMDTRSQSGLEWASGALRETHPDLLVGRTILVNTSGLPLAAMHVNTDQLLALRDEYRLPLFSANVADEQQCRFLARRILTYIETILGCATGIPNLNVFQPTIVIEPQS